MKKNGGCLGFIGFVFIVSLIISIPTPIKILIVIAIITAIALIIRKNKADAVKNKRDPASLLAIQKIVSPAFSNDKNLRLTKEQLEESGELFISQNLQIAMESIDICLSTKNIDTFFSRYSLAHDKLENIIMLEPFFNQAINARNHLEELNLSKSESINQLLDRATLDAINLKTDKGRRARMGQLLEQLKPHESELTKDNIQHFKQCCNEVAAMQNSGGASTKTAPVQHAVENTGSQSKENTCITLDTRQLILNRTNLPSWYLTTSIGNTTSKNLDRAIFLAKKGNLYETQIINGEFIHLATFFEDKQSFINFINLFKLIKEWKSAAFFIRGEIVDRKTIGQIVRCYGDRCQSVNTDFCYGASMFTANPFGCHRLQISASNHPYWSFYVPSGRGTYTLNKAAVLERINAAKTVFEYCPAFDYDKILQTVNSMPLSISERQYNEIIERAQMNHTCRISL